MGAAGAAGADELTTSADVSDLQRRIRRLRHLRAVMAAMAMAAALAAAGDALTRSLFAIMPAAMIVVLVAVIRQETRVIRRLRAQEARMLPDTRPRPDYAAIAAMETGIWGHPFHHAGAPWRCGWPAWCAPGREAGAAEILRAFGVHVTRVTGHPAIPDGEVIVVNPDSGYQPGGIISP